MVKLKCEPNYFIIYEKKIWNFEVDPICPLQTSRTEFFEYQNVLWRTFLQNGWIITNKTKFFKDFVANQDKVEYVQNQVQIQTIYVHINAVWNVEVSWWTKEIDYSQFKKKRENWNKISHSLKALWECWSDFKNEATLTIFFGVTILSLSVLP